MTSQELNWRIEAACLNAWPSHREIVLGGWLLRASGGPTRRANSANPLHPGALIDEAHIERVEATYRRLGQRVLFRVPGIIDGIDTKLAARGYEIDGVTRTLYGDMDDLTLETAGQVSVADLPDEDWLSARDRLSGNDPTGCAAYRAIIASLLLPCGFAAARHEGRIASIAFGAIQDGLLALESVVTDPALRGLGLARQCVSGLILWARQQGVEGVALQVMADNAPARRLYAGLGIGRDLYGYHYRVKA
ncbi:ribosomal protein S18 acetylase RimI-like enzyme [Sphingobium xanthum]|jgi:ribosomal protein S18 acetylase RimI-like enzyme|uniref:GNAT family N-acetyltransferase n=1 Tax=Sphingobium xanthum TaxID=1387165 RepID=UPI001C8B8BC6|nr:GNAT family N-acetyltransferase [Sphingobium xanthum]